eukprot:m.27110 g.27110  ORF g.27110 m.27110 type:complete len:572 (+) comp8450_c0_seq1:296-2011(+)
MAARGRKRSAEEDNGMGQPQPEGPSPAPTAEQMVAVSLAAAGPAVMGPQALGQVNEDELRKRHRENEHEAAAVVANLGNDMSMVGPGGIPVQNSWWTEADGELLNSLSHYLATDLDHSVAKFDKKADWIKWDKILENSSLDFTPESAAQRWERMHSLVAKNRSLLEVIRATQRSFESAQRAGRVLPVKQFNRKTHRTKREPVDPDKPCRPPSSFLIWAKTVRPKLREQYPNKKPTQVGMMLGEMWRKMGEEEKRTYQDQAKALMREYETKMAAYYEANPGAKQKPKLEISDPNAPQPPPRTPFMLFAQERREALEPSTSHGERQRQLGEMWKQLAPHDKESWTVRLEDLKKQHAVQFGQYLMTLPEEQRRRLESANEEQQQRTSKKRRTGIALKQPPNTPYKLYVEDMRDAIAAEHPDWDKPKVTAEIKGMWKGLTKQKKGEYERKLIDKQEEYLKKLKDHGSARRAAISSYKPTRPISARAAAAARAPKGPQFAWQALIDNQWESLSQVASSTMNKAYRAWDARGKPSESIETKLEGSSAVINFPDNCFRLAGEPVNTTMRRVIVDPGRR